VDYEQLARTTLSKRDRFYNHAPQDAFFLTTNIEDVGDYIRARNCLNHGEFVYDVAMAGQGNMNYLVRVTTNLRTFILKQSRPWVEKYSEIAAPFDRALVEGEFYHLAAGTEAATFMPKLYWVDEQSRIICLEDLGTSGDFTNIYSGVPVQAKELEQLCYFLSLLHCTSSKLSNRDMRVLNHFHIFVLPFRPDSNIDLNQFTPGLQSIADDVKANQLLVSRTSELGRLYLSEGRFLLHGDYFPGSWVRSASGIRVIDPEFGFAGPREFDLGVMFAHLLISGVNNVRASLNSYTHWIELDEGLVRGFAGVEILRRILGAAQLPIALDLNRKQSLIETAVRLVV